MKGNRRGDNRQHDNAQKGGANGTKPASASKPVPIGPTRDRSKDEEESNGRKLDVMEEYESAFEQRDKDLPFALSPEKSDSAGKKIPPPVAAPVKPVQASPRKPLKMLLNPTAGSFVPKVVAEAGATGAIASSVVGEGVTSKELQASFAQQAQVLVEPSSNEFSINYDEPAIQARVSHADFEVLKMVGEGGFGRVYQVRHTATKRIYAMKTLRKKFLINTNNVSYTFVERNVLRKVRHPFVCGLHFAFQTKGKVYLIMDFLNGGQIFYHLKRQTMFDETEVQFYAAEIALALSHLHSLGILHRDLKPENILLDGKGHVHLTDFGLARDLAESSVSKTDTYCGTVEYMAPEMVLGQDYGKEVDWWSLGILLFDMLTGSPPWTDKNEKALCDMIATSKLVMPGFLSDSCKSLLKGLLQRDVQKRFDMSALQSHAFFEGLDWAKVLAKEMQPPFVPAVPGGDNCTLNFDDKYIKRKVVAATTPSDHMDELSKSEEAQFHGFSFVRDLPDKLPHHKKL